MAKTMKSNKLALITGSDVLFESQFFIHSPTIKELALKNITEDELFRVLKVLSICKEDFQTGQEEISNFHLLLGVLFNQNYPEKDRENFFKIFELFLKDYSVSLSDLGFILNDKNNPKNFFFLNSDNFDIFQEYIKEIFCFNKIFTSEKSNNEYNVVGDRAKAIAEKLAQRHEKLASQKGEKPSEDVSVISNYMSILSIGIPCDLKDLENKTLYQLFDLLDRYSLYYNYDLDIRCRLAGSTENTEVEYWMKIQ